MLYGITRDIGLGPVLGRLRFATNREAMNYATILNLDADDAPTAAYGVVEVPDEHHETPVIEE